MNSDDTMMFAIVALVMAGILMRPVFRAWARRIESQSGGDVGHELDDLRQRVADLESAHPRMLELEERVDFAERMLAQRGEPERVITDRTLQ